eukprot:Gb_28855 [translate_table: standard]
MFTALGSLRMDPTLALSVHHLSSRLCVMSSPCTQGSALLCNVRYSSAVCYRRQRNYIEFNRQRMLVEHGRCLMLSRRRVHPPHRKEFRRLLVTESELKPWTSRVGEVVNQYSYDRLLQVVLFSPQIPGNTGCIARTCAATAVGLHLVEPLGFQIDDTKLKRAGLDYWPYVVVKIHSSWVEFMDYFKQQEGEKRLLAFTKRGTTLHTDKAYKPGDWLVFGSEISGLSPEALNDCTNESYGGGTIRIPMVETYVRCLNLSVSVGVAVYEASRQLGYEQLDNVSSTFDDNEVNGKALASNEL